MIDEKSNNNDKTLVGGRGKLQGDSAHFGTLKADYASSLYILL